MTCRTALRILARVGMAATLILIAANCHRTPRWPRRYGGIWPEVAASVALTRDGGYIIGGQSVSPGPEIDPQAYLLCTDANGETLWTRTLGGSGQEMASSVEQTADGGYVTAGSTTSSEPNGDAWLARLNPQGETIWTRTYGGPWTDVARAVRQTSDGGFILAGFCYTSNLKDQGWLIKTNASGETTWTHTYGGEDDDQFMSVALTLDGGYLAAGSTRSFGAGDYDLWFVKTDASGIEQWSRTFGGSAADQGYSVIQTRDSSYVAAGSTESMGMGGIDAFVVTISQSGDSLWARSYGNPGRDFAEDVSENSDGDLLVAGASDASNGHGSLDAFLFKLNTDGDIYWANYYGESNYDCANGIRALPDNGCIVAGTTWSSDASEDVYLLRTDRNGDLEN